VLTETAIQSWKTTHASDDLFITVLNSVVSYQWCEKNDFWKYPEDIR